MTDKEMIITVYLNQKIVFDLLAIRENGFAEMYSIQHKETNQTGSNKSIDAEIGTSNVFSFLGVKIGGGTKRDSSKQDDETIFEERIHTPTSLFSRLLMYLTNDGLVKELKNKESLKNIRHGDFVLFKGNLKQNPLIKIFDSFLNLMSLAVFFDYKKQKGTGQQKQGLQDNKQIISQIKGLSDSLKLGNIVDLLCQIDQELIAVLQSEIKFFENQNIGQIEEGNYNVLGKVIKLSTVDYKISLLRNTSLSIAKTVVMDKLIELLNSPDLSISGINVPDSTYEINNGVLIIPIAIYI